MSCGLLLLDDLRLHPWVCSFRMASADGESSGRDTWPRRGGRDTWPPRPGRKHGEKMVCGVRSGGCFGLRGADAYAGVENSAGDGEEGRDTEYMEKKSSPWNGAVTKEKEKRPAVH